ncbi:hypothetical protein HDU97_005818 [Phlyctochytrium planicorne]|nr:hypothetical protein HDU97_005818 [Phlyctochytrium planicorne]
MVTPTSNPSVAPPTPSVVPPPGIRSSATSTSMHTVPTPFPDTRIPIVNAQTDAKTLKHWSHIMQLMLQLQGRKKWLTTTPTTRPEEEEDNAASLTLLLHIDRDYLDSILDTNQPYTTQKLWELLKTDTPRKDVNFITHLKGLVNLQCTPTLLDTYIMLYNDWCKAKSTFTMAVEIFSLHIYFSSTPSI